MSESKQIIQRQIRSFVRREGRMTPSQQRGYDQHHARYGLTIQDAEKQDLTSLFGRNAKKVLEIGFGMGDALLDNAKHYPEFDFIGIEIHRPGVGKVYNQIAEQNLQNVKVFVEDAVLVLKSLPDHSLDVVHIFFPDPWPKKRHHKRRLIQPDFLDLIAVKLQKGGLIHLATDWQDYAEHMFECLDQHPQYTPAPREARTLITRPETKFERRGLKLGHTIVDFFYYTKEGK